MKRLMELIEKEKITYDELEEIEFIPFVETENNGMSGKYNEYIWYSVIYDGIEYDVYVK